MESGDPRTMHTTEGKNRLLQIVLRSPHVRAHIYSEVGWLTSVPDPEFCPSTPRSLWIRDPNVALARPFRHGADVVLGCGWVTYFSPVPMVMIDRT